MKNGCYLVRFRDQRDYETAIMGGPWRLGDTYLTVHRRYKGFNPWKAEIKLTMIWVQLPKLPIEFINKVAVMRIVEAIGKPIRVDRATELGARGKFARVCVEVDLTQPLISQYKIEGITYIIQYEGIDNICTNCGSYGSPTNQCRGCNPIQEMDSDEFEKLVPDKNDPTNVQLYEEWMMVKRREKRLGRQDKEGRAPIKSREGLNRFATLDEEKETEVEEGPPQHVYQNLNSPHALELNRSHTEEGTERPGQRPKETEVVINNNEVPGDAGKKTRIGGEQPKNGKQGVGKARDQGAREVLGGQKGGGNSSRGQEMLRKENSGSNNAAKNGVNKGKTKSQGKSVAKGAGTYPLWLSNEDTQL
ncbi:unnamed protein product [Linum tenue]|uniref:DUF4283 domain-containing protein n=1 Tax=Linum tenue TaxID=586396 RepID=A0AAV0L5V2_9ROSI|nr:unnamed protein product [Linum tenue]